MTSTVVESKTSIPDRDPYIRWSKDGVSFAEGKLSDGFDKVVWTAPRVEGAYSISAEVFPSAPSKGVSYPFNASSSQGLKVMVIAPPGGSGNDFVDSLSFYSLLRLDGALDDVGTRPRSAQPQAIGSPALDTYSSGFGYRFGPKAGVRIPGLMPPGSPSGTIADFAVLIRLDYDEPDGILAKFVSDDASYAIVLGLRSGYPYVQASAEGKTQVSLAESPVSRSPITLEAVFRPQGDMLDISWRAEGARIEAPSLTLPSAPPQGSAVIGGPLSVPGVYDGFGLMVAGAQVSYPSPTYRLAARRQWKNSLIFGDGFEDGVLPARTIGSGGVKAGADSLVLLAGSALNVASSFGVGSGLAVEADIEGDAESCFLYFAFTGGASAFSVRGSGEVLDATGKSLGFVSSEDEKLSFTITSRKDGLLSLVGSTTVTLPISAKRMSLTIKRDSGTSIAVVKKILLRTLVSSIR